MHEGSGTTTFSRLIAEEVLEIGDGYRAKLEELGGNGPIFLRAGLLSERGFDWDTAERFHSSVVSRLQSKLGVAGDTIVTTKGNSIGRTGYVPAGSPEFAYSPHLSYWRSLKPECLNSRFLYYWSRSQEFAAQLEATAHSTDMAPYISLADQRRLKIHLPEVEVQKNVARLLGALDDKIAVNEQVAVTSDDLAASLLQQATNEDREMLEVRLSEIAVINQRKAVPAPNGYLRYVDISSVSRGSIAWPRRTPWGEAPSRARRGVSPGDTIWSTVRPGRRSYALILADDPELVASTGFAVLTPVKVGPAFLYEVTKRDEFVQYLESVAEGSAYPAVRADRFEQATVPLLSPRRLREFEECVMPIRRRANAAQAESRLLADVRDMLLPKLMSGEIRVRDAERVVEDAT